jgi:hypothetical protein
VAQGPKLKKPASLTAVLLSVIGHVKAIFSYQ